MELQLIIDHEELHAKWLNTLSFLENCGARKIAAYEHPTLVKEEMLKHAAEEFRHAFYLKQQIKKISSKKKETYASSEILGGMATRHYLHALEVQVSRFLLQKGDQKEKAYVLVTYAIEKRAEQLYPSYEKLLRKSNSKVTVKSILLEEEKHLEEMEAQMEQWPYEFTESACAIEEAIYSSWEEQISQEVLRFLKSLDMKRA